MSFVSLNKCKSSNSPTTL